jgi:hypothetical protein
MTEDKKPDPIRNEDMGYPDFDGPEPILSKEDQAALDALPKDLIRRIVDGRMEQEKNIIKWITESVVLARSIFGNDVGDWLVNRMKFVADRIRQGGA